MNSTKYNILRFIKAAAAITLLLALSFASVACGLHLASPTPAAPVSPSAEYQLRVIMLDVGQGDSILLESGGQYMLIDAGEPDQGAGVVAKLKQLGVTKLAAVVGTHPHSDHIGGMPAVIGAFRVGAVYLSPKTANTEVYEKLLDAVQAAGLHATAPKQGDTLTLGQAGLQFLWPAQGFESDNENNHSLVIMASAGGRRILLCGDIEKKAEKGILEAYRDIACDVLKVAHHGSDTSSSKDFLKAAKPAVALISVGLDNSFKHPDPDVLKRLKDAGAAIHRTDLNGMVTVTVKDGVIMVQDGNQ